ncbi:MAG: PspC domain-containing protein [Pseudobutyrivibrio sp.]|jgi:phage shock protein PspC (stress-responsive transcriptional regulator)|uniref:PspC domain-containing protein n=2 Tax=Pseudobutyrivibrio TaxID=46205 RepID=A0A2G3DTK1_9FIRM|nr:MULTISPECIES: PspC domain-containing protein [Pseudobutyrivibrio]MBE5904975.1 PspC domain-containing protein [Pseudobutyrivibrio sp.]MBR5951727.1 PspC domain-containing protein [Pseudobutyrivibrio sp.]NEX02751.1 PspC domain-containing protein [Pseudobutyrivibrio xylanivorans]PHU34366.1 PspC domain-containing protein [Pseudobutyrivibrio ruminis]PHU39600.1 PspC domain-containing protein [Pseudobutyrivibrio ruminis]
MNGKKLYKSNNKKICGVCAGVAEYFNIDPTIVRLIWAAFTLAGGSGIIIYIIAALIMDDSPIDVVN